MVLCKIAALAFLLYYFYMTNTTEVFGTHGLWVPSRLVGDTHRMSPSQLILRQSPGDLGQVAVRTSRTTSREGGAICIMAHVVVFEPDKTVCVEEHRLVPGEGGMSELVCMDTKDYLEAVRAPRDRNDDPVLNFVRGVARAIQSSNAARDPLEHWQGPSGRIFDTILKTLPVHPAAVAIADTLRLITPAAPLPHGKIPA